MDAQKNHRKTFIGWKEEVSLSSISLKSNYQGRNEVCGIHNDPSFYPYFVIHDPKISDNFDPWSRKTKLIPSKNWKKIDPILDVAIPVCWPCQRGLCDVLAMAIHLKNIFKKHHFVFLYVSPSVSM